MNVRDLALVVFVFSMLPVTAFHPRFGVYLWYWIAYMAPHRLTWGFAYNYPFAQAAAAATMIGVVLSRERWRFVVTRTTVLLAGLTAWTSVTTLYAVNPRKADAQWKQFLKIQLMTLIATIVINTKEKVRVLVWVIAMSVGFYGIKGGIFTVLSGGQYRVWGPPEGMLAGNNELALGLVVVIPMMWFLRATEPRPWVRHALAMAMVLCGFAILGSHSRGAFLAAACMGTMLALKSGQKKVLIPALIVMALIMYAFAPAHWFQRMETIQSFDEDASAMGRINAWWFAYYLARDRPFVGGGFDAFMPEMFLVYAPDPLDFHDSHSIYFGMLGEHGFVGLGLFLAVGASAWFAAGRVRRHAREQEDLDWAAELASMTQVSMVGYAVNGAFLGLQYFELAYNLIAITIILQTLVIEVPSRERHATELDGERESISRPEERAPPSGDLVHLAAGRGMRDRGGARPRRLSE